MLPPLVDYPNHLARMHLLAEGGDAFYSVRWAPLPNLAEDLIVPPLARLMPLDTAAKLFLVMIFALMAGGVVWLNRVATGAWRLWPLLGFLLLYNRILLWGFLNYLSGSVSRSPVRHCGWRWKGGAGGSGSPRRHSWHRLAFSATSQPSAFTRW